MTRPRGPHPQPTTQKVLKGTLRGKPNLAEPKMRPGLPKAPGFLYDEAKAEWDRVSVDLYEAGILSKVDRAILAAYCQAFARWEIAETKLAELRAGELTDEFGGLLVETKQGNIIQHPLAGVANRAMDLMAKYATDLGLTPSARSRVTASPIPGANEDSDEEFFSTRH